MNFAIRPYHPSDIVTLYRICLLTGANGEDASTMYKDHEIVAHYYVGPYVVLEPDVCFTLTSDGVPCGYMIGTRDSIQFGERTDREWFPALRARYSLPAQEDHSPDARMIRAIHEGSRPEPELAAYPAHLHIDLLPFAQGQGWGRKLIQTFCGRLRELGVPAVHLGASKNNGRAVAFYDRVGFHRIAEDDGGILFGMHLR